MELKHKEQKIRDMVVFYFGLLPVEVDVDRHDVKIVFEKRDIERLGVSLEDVREKIQPVVPRTLTLDVV